MDRTEDYWKDLRLAVKETNYRFDGKLLPEDDVESFMRINFIEGYMTAKGWGKSFEQSHLGSIGRDDDKVQ